MKSAPNDINILAKEVTEGRMKAVARAIHIVENRLSSFDSLLDKLWPEVGGSHRIGIAGAPGVGKSTFTNQLIKYFRKYDRKVGVIAIDPSSPVSGGTLFGDRIRMSEMHMDSKVFIRSMSTRGVAGGLAMTAEDVADILDASGKDVIIIETAGVGQIELDVVSAVDTVCVMTMPGAGDAVQGLKSGIMETGDIYIVNKADLPNAEEMKHILDSVLMLRSSDKKWKPEVRCVDSLQGKGLREIAELIITHRQYLRDSGSILIRKKKHIENRIRRMIDERIISQYWTDDRHLILQKALDDIIDKKLSPYSAYKNLVK